MEGLFQRPLAKEELVVTILLLLYILTSMGIRYRRSNRLKKLQKQEQELMTPPKPVISILKNDWNNDSTLPITDEETSMASISTCDTKVSRAKRFRQASRKLLGIRKRKKNVSLPSSNDVSLVCDNDEAFA